MASTLQVAKAKDGKVDKKVKVMGTSAVSPKVEFKTDEARKAQLDPTLYVGKTSKKEDNFFKKGEKIVFVGEYAVPLAYKPGDDPHSALNRATAMVNGKLEDVLFWFDYGRKVAARTQATLGLGLEFTSDKEDEKEAEDEIEQLEDLARSFKNAMSNMITESTSEERKNAIMNFILSEEKFAPIRDKMEVIKNPAPKFFDFGSEKLKKPTGVRGRRKADPAESEAETEVEA